MDELVKTASMAKSYTIDSYYLLVAMTARLSSKFKEVIAAHNE